MENLELSTGQVVTHTAAPACPKFEFQAQLHTSAQAANFSFGFLLLR